MNNKLIRENCDLIQRCYLGAYVARQMDLDGKSKEGREVTLDRSEWKEQYKSGVNRCMGFDVLWA